MRDKRIKLIGIQRIIAKKMAESKNKIPHVTTIREVNVDKIVKLREKFKSESNHTKSSFMAFVIKAAGEALEEFPIINSSFDDINNEIILKKEINIGLAISVQGNLLVPVIKNVNKLNFDDLIHATNDIIVRSRNNQLNPEDFKYGTFTISNSGAFGGEIFTPIINYPQSAILGIGRIQKKPIAEDNDIKVANMMYLSLSYDHRIINGSEAVKFLGKLETIFNSSENFII